MLDHIGLEVCDYEKSKAFYTAALAPLCYELVMEWEGYAGFGAGGNPDLWINGGKSGGLSCGFSRSLPIADQGEIEIPRRGVAASSRHDEPELAIR